MNSREMRELLFNVSYVQFVMFAACTCIALRIHRERIENSLRMDWVRFENLLRMYGERACKRENVRASTWASDQLASEQKGAWTKESDLSSEWASEWTSELFTEPWVYDNIHEDWRLSRDGLDGKKTMIGWWMNFITITQYSCNNWVCLD